MRVLVTGGAGFIGSNYVLQALADAKVSVLVNLDKLTYAGNPANLATAEYDPRYRFTQGDIGDRELVKELLERNEIEAVMNFAAESHVDRSIDGPEAFVQTNVVGTLRLSDTVLRYWRGLPEGKKEKFRFLHVSTDEVFGSLGAEDEAFHEDTPFAPNSPYAASKASSDHLVSAYHHTYGLPVVTTNCSNNYGPLQFPEKLIPLMILNAIEGKSSADLRRREECEGLAVCRGSLHAIRLVLERGEPGETYNVGGMCERQNIQVVERICDLLDELAPIHRRRRITGKRVTSRDRPGHDRRYAINCSKIARELEWKPWNRLKQGWGRR